MVKEMKAMITGASSGIGREMAIYLGELGYDLILVARQKDKLEELQSELKTKVKLIIADLSLEQKVKEVYVLTKQEKIDLLINNAGFGVFGVFDQTDLKEELNMIDVNIKAVHMLTKFFLKDMEERNHGTILNVASSAAFYPGPLMASYYASKSYVYRLSLALQEELRRKKSKVQLSVLCPGPIETNFQKRAGVKFQVKPLSSFKVARYTIDQMRKGKKVIIPGISMKIAKFFSHFISDTLLAKIAYHMQKKKEA